MKKAAKTTQGYQKPARRRKSRVGSARNRRAPAAFFVARTLSDLADAQGVKPLNEPNLLKGGWPAGENLDDFLDEIYKSRTAPFTP